MFRSCLLFILRAARFSAPLVVSHGGTTLEGCGPWYPPFRKDRETMGHPPFAVPSCLPAYVGSLFRSRVDEKFAHLTHRIAGDGALARPRECLVHVGGFQYPET